MENKVECKQTGQLNGQLNRYGGLLDRLNDLIGKVEMKAIALREFREPQPDSDKEPIREGIIGRFEETNDRLNRLNDWLQSINSALESYID